MQSPSDSFWIVLRCVHAASQVDLELIEQGLFGKEQAAIRRWLLGWRSEEPHMAVASNTGFVGGGDDCGGAEHGAA